MPPTSPEPVTQHRSYAVLFTLLGVMVLVLLGLGAWQYYALVSPKQETHVDFYTGLVQANTAFAQAEELVKQARFAEALPLYEQALQQATNDEERKQIRFMTARTMVLVNNYASAVPILKEIATNPDPGTARAKATAVVELASIVSQGMTDLNLEIFKDEPLRSLWAANDPTLTLRHMYEYAASLYPVAVAELRIAEWYANQLRSADITTSVVEEYKSKIAQLMSDADTDITYLQQDGTMVFDLRYALLMRANVVAALGRAGDSSYGSIDEQFQRAIDTYAQAGAGHDCIARYQYALHLAQAYGAARKSDIQTVLKPLSSTAYAQSGGCMFLSSARSSAYHRQFPAQIAKIDADFKAFLLTIGWTEADFSS